jgi:hypothetical protein
MFRKTALIVFIFSFVTFAQNQLEQVILPGKEYPAGTRVQNAYRGISFIIPRDWQGAMPPDQRVFLMNSPNKPGMGIAIFQSAFSEAEIIRYLSQSQNLGDNIILKPVGEPKVSGNDIRMEYTSMTNTGVALAIRGNFNNTVIFLFTGPANLKDYYRQLLDKIKPTVVFLSPDPSKLRKAWENALTGKMLKKVSVEDDAGNYPTLMHLCPDGKTRIVLPADHLTMESEPTLIDGFWKVETDDAQSYLVITPVKQKAVRARLNVIGSYVVLGNGRYYLTSSNICK